ncbi:hypothetical protein H6F78_19725 [Coleofasciculus sp. FACHB-64]|uniref:hypothetical protein n=1 Tax=Cyanophyceae TaxID=3028117 RepID=UPI0016832C96|nr:MULTISPECIES: hypothetical protein [unclassified Coleofasciculus]MBD1841219.1 hypothetical protein [Coleofasciculus sp. FACHB-501]MBD1901385.1 hypothetical protein [Coleofasciculus sp. FACHB-125]MBD2047788.1 hypothetical protein [Coleofasciculus sp. FACHB-64]
MSCSFWFIREVYAVRTGLRSDIAGERAIALNRQNKIPLPVVQSGNPGLVALQERVKAAPLG